jgi:hypothetical protein
LKQVGGFICDVLDDILNEALHARTKSKIQELTRRFPLYPSRT